MSGLPKRSPRRRKSRTRCSEQGRPAGPPARDLQAEVDPQAHPCPPPDRGSERPPGREADEGRMARPQLTAWSVALALGLGACDGGPGQAAAAQSSVTVKLPPARPHAPAPAFRAVANNRIP